MAEDTTAKAGGAPVASQATQAGDTADPKEPGQSTAVLTQEKVNEILARERKAWERQHKEEFDKAKAHDALVAQQKQKEEADKSELEKATTRVKELEPLETATKEWDAWAAKILEQRLTQIPEEKKLLIPEGLGTKATLEYLETRASFFFGPPSSGGPSTQVLGQTRPDPLTEKALALLAETYSPTHPLRFDKPAWDAKVAGAIQWLKDKDWKPPTT